MTIHNCHRCCKDWECDQPDCRLPHRSGCDECAEEDGWKPEEVKPHSKRFLNRKAAESEGMNTRAEAVTA